MQGSTLASNHPNWIAGHHGYVEAKNPHLHEYSMSLDWIWVQFSTHLTQCRILLIVLP